MNKNYFYLLFVCVFIHSNSFGQNPTYCEMYEDILSVEEITLVEFSNLTIENTNTSDTWLDFISEKADVEKGESYLITLKGNTVGDFTSEFVAFIDWDKNGTLDDDGEVFYIGAIKNSDGFDEQSATLNILIPDDVEIGETRIRITKTYTDPDEGEVLFIDPCAISTLIEEIEMIGNLFGQALDFTLNITEATSSVSTISKNQFQIYPNPTSSLLNISSEEAANRVIVYNLQGQNILNFEGNSIESLDVSSLATGNYIINISSDTNSESLKFIKE